MKHLIVTLFSLVLTIHLNAQDLIVNKTLFLGCEDAGAKIEDGIKTDDGGVIFVGFSTCDNKGDITAANKGNKDALIGKLDKNNNLLWLKQLGGKENDAARNICRSKNGKDYAVLIQTTSTDGDIPIPVQGKNCWVIVVDESGKLKWSKLFGSTGGDGSLSIAAATDSGFILLGTSNGSDGDIPFQYNPSPFSYDWFLVKMDSLGNKQWSKTIGGTGGESESGTIIAALEGYYIVGASNSKDYDCIDTNWKHNNTNGDYFILQIDDTGKVEWSRRHGTSEGDGMRDAIWDERDSSIVIVGSSRGNDLIATGNHGKSDMLIVKVDKSGNLLWAKLLGGKENENIYQSVCTTGKSEYASYTKSGSTNLGSDDTWLFILDKDGNTLQDIAVGGNDRDYVGSVIPYNDDLMLVGQTESKQFTLGTGSSGFANSAPGYFSLLHYSPLSILEQSSAHSKIIKLIPNPAANSVQVHLPAIQENTTLLILDHTGKQVAQYSISSNSDQFTINTERLPQGSYLVTWKSKHTSNTQRLIIHY